MMQKIQNLLTQPTQELGKWSRFLALQIRIWFHCFRLLGVNRCFTQAAALAYHTIFGLVPLAIVTLMVFQMFPAADELGDRLRNYAYEQLNLTIMYPSGAATAQNEAESATAEKTKEATLTAASKLEEITQGAISKTSSGTITIVGVLLIFLAAIALLGTVERTFNQIYHVGAGRRFLHRLFNYWGLLTLGVIFLMALLYVHTQSIVAVDLYKVVMNIIQPIIPFLTSLLTVFCLYLFLPNTRVSPGAAIWGAFVVTVIWTAAKTLFSWYVRKFLPEFAVYGTLGLIPVTVLWIYICWLIVLFGLQLTYATQNIKRLDAAEFAKARRQERCFLANDQTVIRVMEYVLNAFERKDQKPVSVEAVAWRLSMPTDFAEKILKRLVQSGLLCHTNEPCMGYVPSTDGAHITLDEISRAIGEVSFAQPGTADATNLQQVFDEMQGHLARYTLKQVLSKDENFRQSDEAMPQSADNQEEMA